MDSFVDRDIILHQANRNPIDVDEIREVLRKLDVTLEGMKLDPQAVL